MDDVSHCLASLAQLPVTLDLTGIEGELARIQADDWIQHYRTEHYVGDWGVVALRSLFGHPSQIYSVPANNQSAGFRFENTPLLEASPGLKRIVEGFPCPVNAARLMKLGAGARILEHSDDMGEGESKEVRVHVPLQTNDQVEFYLGGELVNMREGEAWVGDFSLPHRVDNLGASDRIHLVLDVMPDEWFWQQIHNINLHLQHPLTNHLLYVFPKSGQLWAGSRCRPDGSSCWGKRSGSYEEARYWSYRFRQY